MVSESDVLLRQLLGKAEVRFLPGAFRGLDSDQRAIVDFSGGRVPAHVLGQVPAINDSVWVEVVDGVAYMHGPTTPKPDQATVLTAVTGVATLTTTIGEVQAAYDDGLLLLDPGDIVRVWWGPSGAWILGVTVEADEVSVPPAPGGGGGRQTREFTAIDSGSWQAGYGWRTQDIWSSASNKSGWFYGTQICDTIPDSAVIAAAQIYLPSPIRLLGAAPFGRHPYASKPGGEPAISATSTLPGTSGWIDIPTSLIDHLKANVGGLGFDLGGYNIWPGGGQSGTVRVTYDS